MPNTTLQPTSSPDISTVSNTLYNRTSWTSQHTLSSDHLHIITTINIRHEYRQKTTNIYQLHESRMNTISAFLRFSQTNTHTANIIFTNIILMADRHNITNGKMHSNYRLLPDHIVCKIIQRNNTRRGNTSDPTLK